MKFHSIILKIFQFRKNNFKIKFLILKYIFTFFKNKIFKNLGFLKKFFQFRKNNFKMNFLILKYIFLIFENKILKNPRFLIKIFFNFVKIVLKLVFYLKKDFSQF